MKNVSESLRKVTHPHGLHKTHMNIEQQSGCICRVHFLILSHAKTFLLLSLGGPNYDVP